MKKIWLPYIALALAGLACNSGGGTKTTNGGAGGSGGRSGSGGSGGATGTGGVSGGSGGSASGGSTATGGSGGSTANGGSGGSASGGSTATGGSGGSTANGGSGGSASGGSTATGGSGGSTAKGGNSGGGSTASGGASGSGGSSGGAGGGTVVVDPKTDEIIGFGRNTVGGKGGKVVTVTTIEELISAAASAGPMIINVKGQLVHSAASGGGDADRILVASYKTIQGADPSASINANITNARENESASNIIIRNIKLENPEGKGTGDAIEFTNGVSNIWVDHVTFGQCADGALDFKRGADLVTVSWCKFDYPNATARHNYANLVGHSDQYPELDRGKLRVTFHHNWYTTNAQQRMPRVRYGQVHVFNNYYSPALRPPEKTGTGPDYIIGVGVEAQILLEASYFENPNGHTWTGSTAWYDWFPAEKCTEACATGRIQWTDDNVFSKGTMAGDWAPNSDVFDPPYPYRHALQSATDARQSTIDHAGVLK